MYNDHISPEEAKELIKQRTQEAESYSQQKQLGFGDSWTVRWALLIIVILAVIAIGVLF